MFQQAAKSTSEMFTVTKQNYPVANRVQTSMGLRVVELSGQDVYKLERKTHTINVLSGTAWITMDGQDYYVRCGEEMTLTVKRDRAIISSPKNSPLTFEIW